MNKKLKGKLELKKRVWSLLISLIKVISMRIFIGLQWVLLCLLLLITFTWSISNWEPPTLFLLPHIIGKCMSMIFLLIMDECNYHGKILENLACGSYRMIDNNQDHKKLFLGRFHQEEADSKERYLTSDLRITKNT